MANPTDDPQAGLEEVPIDDADIRQAVTVWAERKKKAAALNVQIKALEVDDMRDRVAALLPTEDEKVTYRIIDTPYKVTIAPPGESKPVAFDTSPSRRLTLGEVEPEPEGIQAELGDDE